LAVLVHSAAPSTSNGMISKRLLVPAPAGPTPVKGSKPCGGEVADGTNRESVSVWAVQRQLHFPSILPQAKILLSEVGGSSRFTGYK
jgi:hypothetical protein